MADIPDVSQLPTRSPNPLAEMAGESMSQVAPPPQPGGRVRSLLSNFFQGAGSAMMQQVGLPTPQEQAQQAFNNDLALRRQKSVEDYHDILGENAGLKIQLQQQKQAGQLVTPELAASVPSLAPMIGKPLPDAFAKLMGTQVTADTSLANTETKEGGLNTRLTQTLDSREAIAQMVEAGKAKRAQFLQRVLGTYSHVTDEAGNITGFYNNKDPLGSFIRAPEDIGRKTAMPAEMQRMSENAASGLRALDHLEAMIKADPNQLILAAIPGGLGARELLAAKKEVTDVITRLRTGAALNESEEKFYGGQVPTALDLSEPEAIAYKIGLLRNLFTGLQQRGRGGSSGRPPAGGGNVAPEGTRIKVGNQFQVKHGGKWVPE